MSQNRSAALAGLVLLVLTVLPALRAQQVSPENFNREAIQFFETEIRPLFQKNCAACHNEELRTSGLSLKTRKDILTGGNRGPSAVPRSPSESRLLQAVKHEGELKMPPTGKLPERQIAALERWVELGMPWGKSAAKQESAERPNADHWAFQPVKRYELPEVKNESWVRNGIDNFILARLERKGIEPSPEADKRTLIRRLSLDLLGLPPTPEQVEQFLSDNQPGAYERLVDRLLKSPHYGERWGRHWLDLARYADTDGYNIDAEREIWMYRDWVIDALNRDLPFDRFVVEQFAADLLPNATKEQIVATGFHRNTLLNQEGGIDFEQYRVEAVVDRVSTTGEVFLGLTLGCARCHDHKYDPISQREFYEFFAFFNNIDELSREWGEEGRQRAHDPVLEFGSPQDFARKGAFEEQLALLEKEFEEYEESFREEREKWEKSITEEELAKLDADIRHAIRTPPEERNEFQWKQVKRGFSETPMGIGIKQRREGINAFRKAKPKLVTTMVMRELPEPRKAYVHIQGDFLREGVQVKPGTPAVLPALSANGRANRLDLARWIVDPANPLTPRVTVNRIWQRYFGTGIVATENDFGTQGATPSHPELLDWLAAKFIDSGWSLKATHRLIVTSATYRQSSEYREELKKIDPRNRLLARQNRLRLESEVVRDNVLAAGGILSQKMGGPSVFPPQPEGASKLGQVQKDWVPSEGEDRYRRGLYTFFRRSSPFPGLMVFDSPNSMTAATKRTRSNTPLQALTLLNDEAFYEAAQGLASRILLDGPEENSRRLDYAFEICLARPPHAGERQRMQRFLAGQLDEFQTDPEDANEVLFSRPPDGTDVPELAAWTMASSVLLNLDEFITRE